VNVLLFVYTVLFIRWDCADDIMATGTGLQNSHTSTHTSQSPLFTVQPPTLPHHSHHPHLSPPHSVCSADIGCGRTPRDTTLHFHVVPQRPQTWPWEGLKLIRRSSGALSQEVHSAGYDCYVPLLCGGDGRRSIWWREVVVSVFLPFNARCHRRGARRGLVR